MIIRRIGLVLAVLIGVAEVIKAGQQIIERTYESVLIYGALFLFFFIRKCSRYRIWRNAARIFCRI